MKAYLQKIVRVFATAVITLASVSAFAATTTIDVLVVYTKGVSTLYGGDPTTRINQLFQVTNQIYADSGVDLEIRVAKTMQVDYTDDNAAETALNNITFNQHAAFSGVAAAREQAKADMVIFYRPYMNSHGNCGVAWIGGSGSNGVFNAAQKAYMYAHVAVNSCGDFVTAHELGHNMGLKHSRKQDGTGGTFHYALGYGVVNSFATIMAYQTEFNVDYWTGKIYKFSNPDLKTCKNQACGVDRNNTTSGADARYALNITAPQIANFYASTSAVNSSSSKANSSALASSKSSSSASSVANVDLTALAAKVESARLTYEAAVAAVNANKLAITEKTALERTAKTELTTATKNATTVTKNYEKAVTKYNGLVTKANAMVVQLNAAVVAYNAATTTAAKSAKLTAYNTLVTKYNDLLAQLATTANEVNAAQQAIAPATEALVQATAKSNAATAAAAAEKAKTANLTAAVTASLATYKDLQLQYKTAQKTIPK
ncbi:MAG: zinc-dependent metalloprotease [Cellvibrio sp.]|uniref:zinc-dependent metalloprotease n=1 Tax=Cellvibrio sp. TaxID=1965322 RepID=UPI0031B2ED6C